MSTNGETADLMVREGIQITESALKLAGLGAKNLAALLIALANDNQKLAGKTNLKRLIHDGEELTIFSVKQEDLKGFQMEAKRYGVLFYPIVNITLTARTQDCSDAPPRTIPFMSRWTSPQILTAAKTPPISHLLLVRLPLIR